MSATEAIPTAPEPPSEHGFGTVLASVRSFAFLNRQRVRAYGVMIAIAYLPMLAKAFIEATGSVGSDFLAFWGAGKLVVAGLPAKVYDIATEQAVQALAGTGQLVVYVNPPPYLFLTAPLGLMPYAAAWIAWVVAGWALWFTVARRLLPDAGIAVLAFPGAYLAASHAQNGFVTGALLIGAALALRRSQALSGALFGALIIKPHLALLVPLWLAAGRKWTAFCWAALSAVLLCLASLLVFGADTWAAYPESFKASAVLMANEHGGPFFLRMATLYAGLRYHFDPTTALVGQGVVTIATAAAACLYWRRAKDEMAAGAMLLAATALASPYLFSYDLPFMAMPLFWLVAEARTTGWRPWEKLACVALWLAPLATRAIALPLHLNLMPLAAAGLVWMVWRRGATTDV
ncbi:glycosyltransferase family 87 protein [Novosphingobium sp.]|uniref:glycosyltransferase family 87 protein n=1 Tax=Novosphingobium sp. TaxID=1874826 RepID=UPI0038B7A551